jgi:cytochrome c oxidase cbb3-type subunit 2
MNATVLGLLVLAAAAPDSTPLPPSGQSWDLRWMVGPTSGRPTVPPPRPSERLHAAGRSLYRSRCAGCHGANGNGKGPLAARLAVPPTNFVAGVYKLRSTPPGAIPTDEDLFATLSRGVHGTPMMPWAALTEEQRWALVHQLKSFSVRFREERPPEPVHIPAVPREGEALRRQGAELYARLRCVACHGEEGAGNGPAAKAYEATPSRDVRIRDFTRGRFIRGAQMEDIYLTLRTGLEGTPMGAYDALSDEQIWALAAYVRSLVGEWPWYELPPARTHARGESAGGAGGRP